MDRQKLIWYVLAPLGSALVMVLMYFSGVHILHQIIAPTIEGMYGNSQREFGLLENAQNVFLLVTLGFMIHALRLKTTKPEKAAFTFGALVTLFILLEEIDYGLHFYELFHGIDAKEAARERNWHNQGDRTDSTKKIMDAGMIILFVAMPLFLARVKNAYVRYIVPSRWGILTLLGSVLLSRFAHLLNDMGYGEGGNIRTNISEFREYLNYWLIMIFVHDVVYKRTLFEAVQSDETEPEPSDVD